VLTPPAVRDAVTERLLATVGGGDRR